jgi:hypothetical protein
MSAGNVAGVAGRDSSRSWTWLLVLPFSNGGSTALARILLTAPTAAGLGRRAEGQWLVPELRQPRLRWDPHHEVDLARVRDIWVEALRHDHPGAEVVVEKSPPNLLRYRPLIDALAPMPVVLVTFSRDPYATCASWHQRYGPRKIRRAWGLPEGASIGTEAAYFQSLATIWAQRAELMLRARAEADLHTSYEQFCAAPAQVVCDISRLVPPLGDADPSAPVEVKDHPTQPLRNMNSDQVGSLSPSQVDALSQVFAQHEPVLRQLGYALR